MIRNPCDFNRERLATAMREMDDGASAEAARETLLEHEWIEAGERDGECWVHRAGPNGNVEVEVSDGQIYLYNFERGQEVSGLEPHELRAFAVLADQSRGEP